MDNSINFRCVLEIVIHGRVAVEGSQGPVWTGLLDVSCQSGCSTL